MLDLFVQDSLAGLRSLRSLISLIQLVSGRRALEMLVRRIEAATSSGKSDQLLGEWRSRPLCLRTL
jgi:hypothetical protein